MSSAPTSPYQPSKQYEKHLRSPSTVAEIEFVRDQTTTQIIFQELEQLRQSTRQQFRTMGDKFDQLRKELSEVQAKQLDLIEIAQTMKSSSKNSFVSVLESIREQLENVEKRLEMNESRQTVSEQLVRLKLNGSSGSKTAETQYQNLLHRCEHSAEKLEHLQSAHTNLSKQFEVLSSALQTFAEHTGQKLDQAIELESELRNGLSLRDEQNELQFTQVRTQLKELDDCRVDDVKQATRAISQHENMIQSIEHTLGALQDQHLVIERDLLTVRSEFTTLHSKSTNSSSSIRLLTEELLQLKSKLSRLIHQTSLQELGLNPAPSNESSVPASASPQTATTSASASPRPSAKAPTQWQSPSLASASPPAAVTVQVPAQISSPAPALVSPRVTATSRPSARRSSPREASQSTFSNSRARAQSGHLLGKKLTDRRNPSTSTLSAPASSSSGAWTSTRTDSKCTETDSDDACL